MNSDATQTTQRMLVDGIEAAMREHMPPCAYRDLCRWAFSAGPEDRATFLHLLGIPQFARMTVALFDGLIRPEEAAKLARYSALMNTYLSYEVVSDDLALGLARGLPGDDTVDERRAVLLAFNEAMIRRLAGEPRPASDLLAPIAPEADAISGFRQTLNHDKHEALARRYLGAHPGATRRALDRSIFPRLAVNIETCWSVARMARELNAGPLVLHGLTSRYRAVSTLIEDRAMGLTRRAFVSADAILVVPTLAYYAGVLAEHIRPNAAFPAVVADGTLGEPLFLAALAIRLLNDVGTTPLERPEARAVLSRELRASMAHGSDPTLATALLSVAGRSRATLTRLNKDLSHGEFNLALLDITELPVSQALPIFERRLEALAAMYADVQHRLPALLVTLGERLGDEGVSTLIDRFMRFHEAIYRHDYATPEGDYTV